MAFTDMNDVDQDLGEARPGVRSNRNFMIIAGVLGGIMVLALLCIAGLALFKYLPGQSAAQQANATNEAQATSIAFAATQTSSLPRATKTKVPTAIPPTAIPPTKTIAPTNTAVIIIEPTKSPTFDAPMATIYAMRTQRILQATATLIPSVTSTSQVTPPTPTSSPTARPTLQPTARQTSAPSPTALPQTGLAEEMGTTGLIAAGFILVAIIFLTRRLRTAS